jgi:hypothetical protein
MCSGVHYYKVDVFFEDNSQYDTAKIQINKLGMPETPRFNKAKKVITFPRQYSVSSLKNHLTMRKIAFKEAHLEKKVK